MKVENRIIEVSSDKKNWFTRVLLFIKNNKAYCWSDVSTLEEAETVETILVWNYWREISKSEYRPFTWGDKDSLRGKWVRYKKLNLEAQITGLELFEGGLLISLHKGVSIKSEGLLKYYEFIDGTPCGVKINED